MEQLSQEQRQHWFEEAGYWGAAQDAAEEAGIEVPYADERRANALRMLGMIASEQ
jgi:hypothetical protein